MSLLHHQCAECGVQTQITISCNGHMAGAQCCECYDLANYVSGGGVPQKEPRMSRQLTKQQTWRDLQTQHVKLDNAGDYSL